jgi:Skp family chaperone for outer membrane proteins
MKYSENLYAYSRELSALISSGVDPEEAKAIADAHESENNYNKCKEQIAEQRKADKRRRREKKEQNEKLNKYARALTARIVSGENPTDVVEDMEGLEM